MSEQTIASSVVLRYRILGLLTLASAAGNLFWALIWLLALGMFCVGFWWIVPGLMALLQVLSGTAMLIGAPTRGGSSVPVLSLLASVAGLNPFSGLLDVFAALLAGSIRASLPEEDVPARKIEDEEALEPDEAGRRLDAVLKDAPGQMLFLHVTDRHVRRHVQRTYQTERYHPLSDSDANKMLDGLDMEALERGWILILSDCKWVGDDVPQVRVLGRVPAGEVDAPSKRWVAVCHGMSNLMKPPAEVFRTSLYLDDAADLCLQALSDMPGRSAIQDIRLRGPLTAQTVHHLVNAGVPELQTIRYGYGDRGHYLSDLQALAPLLFQVSHMTLKGPSGEHGEAVTAILDVLASLERVELRGVSHQTVFGAAALKEFTSYDSGPVQPILARHSGTLELVSITEKLEPASLDILARCTRLKFLRVRCAHMDLRLLGAAPWSELEHLTIEAGPGRPTWDDLAKSCARPEVVILDGSHLDATIVPELCETLLANASEIQLLSPTGRAATVIDLATCEALAKVPRLEGIRIVGEVVDDAALALMSSRSLHRVRLQSIADPPPHVAQQLGDRFNFKLESRRDQNGRSGGSL